MDLDAIEACGPGELGGSREVGDDPGGLIGFQSSGSFVGLGAFGSVDVIPFELDGRGSDRRLTTVERAVRRPTAMPELEDDRGARRF